MSADDKLVIGGNGAADEDPNDWAVVITPLGTTSRNVYQIKKPYDAVVDDVRKAVTGVAPLEFTAGGRILMVPLAGTALQIMFKPWAEFEKEMASAQAQKRFGTGMGAGGPSG